MTSTMRTWKLFRQYRRLNRNPNRPDRKPGEFPGRRRSWWKPNPAERLELMHSARFQPQASDDGGGVGRIEARAEGVIRRRNARWGWTRSSHAGREFADWMVIWVRSRWRRG